MTNNYRNGDCNITKCQLSSLDGKRSVNVIGQIAHINIYESVVQPVIVGDIEFIDGIGLKNNFPLIGEEVLTLEFNTPTQAKISLTFYLWQYSDVVFSDNNKSQAYHAQMITKEGLVNNTKLISRRLNDQISTSVENILKDDLKSTANINVSPTVGIDNYLMSNCQPLKLIDSLRHRAISAKYKSSSFVFYQDRNGFNFVPLEQMLVNAASPKFIYNYDDSIDSDITKDGRYDNLLSYLPVQTTNIIDKLHYGGTANIVKRFDIITGETTDVAYSDSNDLFVKTGKQGQDQSSMFTQMFGLSTGSKTLVTFDEGTSEHLNEKVSNLKGFVNRVNQNIVNVSMYGNSDITIGDSIKVAINNATGLTGVQNKSEVNTFIVSKIRHMISVSNRPSYANSLELIGNSING